MDNNQFNNQNQQYQNPYNQQPQQPVSPYQQPNAYQQPNQGYDNQQQYNQQPNQQYQDPSQQNYYQQPNPYTNPADFVAQQEEKKAKNFAVASLVLSLVSFVCFGIVCSILGLVFGIKSKKLKPDNNGMATAGIILSIIALVLCVIFLIFNTFATVTLNSLDFYY